MPVNNTLSTQLNGTEREREREKEKDKMIIPSVLRYKLNPASLNPFIASASLTNIWIDSKTQLGFFLDQSLNVRIIRPFEILKGNQQISHFIVV